MRPMLVWLHRWVGLGLTAFLVIEGATGALLAFRADLSALLSPHLLASRPASGAIRLDLATLAQRAEALAPRAEVAYFVGLSDHQAVLRMLPRKDPSTGEPYQIDAEILTLDPWTGAELGRSSFSRYTDGFLPNIMPFVYDLHTTLAGSVFGIGEIGIWVLAVVAFLWTIDCFNGLFLTLPVSLTGFWGRWQTAWRIKRKAGVFRLNFDLHRAGGLWLWPMLLIFAWSSVTLVDKFGIYDNVTRTLLDYPVEDVLGELFPERGGGEPAKLGWREAQDVGERLMAEQAARRGFKIEEPLALNHLIDSRLYNYIVRTDRSFPSDRMETVFFDADTGMFRFVLPTRAGHSGLTITNWLRALHLIQDPVDYLVYRLLVVVTGVVTVIVSMTGIYIWWRKRSARVKRPRRDRGHESDQKPERINLF
jgi:uncharacterized iron-regulated membrane protein